MKSEVLLFVSLVLISSTLAILLDGTFSCPAIAPCVCSGAFTISCVKMNFMSMPQFNYSTRDFGHMLVRLEINHITHVPDGAFSKLGGHKQTQIAINLQVNNISSIDEHAFEVISNQVISLNLEYNRLTHLPTALKTLVNLTTLRLAYNPLLSLDSTVMSAFLQTLTWFSFGIDSKVYPASAINLPHLTRLTIAKSQLESIATAFEKNHNTLQLLTLGASNLDRIPDSICQLRNLRTLAFDTSYVVDSNTMIPYCHPSLGHAQTLKLLGNGLIDFPHHIFSTFTHLETLEIYSMHETFTGLEYADFPDDCSLKRLSLRHDTLVTVPQQVTALPHLEVLDMAANNIQCGCLMKWMLHWPRRQNVTIRGNCDNYHNKSIQDFVNNDLDLFC